MHRADGGVFQRFRTQGVLEKIPGGRVVIACSGGADSTALLHMLNRLSREYDFEVIAAHVQHHLRGKESLRDEKFVRTLAKKLKIPFKVRSIHLGPALHKDLKKLGMEGAARVLRYRALGEIAKECGARSVVTAHTADDQAETFLLHLLRGAGAQSLSGIRPQIVLEGALVLRPLLNLSRSDVLSYLKSQKLSYCEDSSNSDTHYRRNWVRHKLLPLMREVQPRISEIIAGIAGQL